MGTLQYKSKLFVLVFVFLFKIYTFTILIILFLPLHRHKEGVGFKNNLMLFLSSIVLELMSKSCKDDWLFF